MEQPAIQGDALGNGNVILNVKQLQSVSVYGTTVQGGTHKIHIPPTCTMSITRKNTSFPSTMASRKLAFDTTWL